MSDAQAAAGIWLRRAARELGGRRGAGIVVDAQPPILYLDNSALNRPLDVGAHLATEQVSAARLLRAIGAGRFRFLSSQVLVQEALRAPAIRLPVLHAALDLAWACVLIGPTEALAQRLVVSLAFRRADALHVAAAYTGGAAYCVSCDRHFLGRAGRAVRPRPGRCVSNGMLGTGGTMMAAPASAPIAVSPLGRLLSDERERAIAALSAQLPAKDAAGLLSALAGSDEEVLALPQPLRLRGQEVLLEAFPPGVNVAVVGVLALAAVDGGDDWMERARDEIDAAPSMEAAAALIRERLAAYGRERSARREP